MKFGVGGSISRGERGALSEPVLDREVTGRMVDWARIERGEDGEDRGDRGVRGLMVEFGFKVSALFEAEVDNPLLSEVDLRSRSGTRCGFEGILRGLLAMPVY